MLQILDVLGEGGGAKNFGDGGHVVIREEDLGDDGMIGDLDVKRW